MKISTILDHIDSGHMALPEFQRGYVWNRDQVRRMMESLYCRHPIGSLLVWVTESESATFRGNTELPPGVVKLLLDGQQRMTSLYGIVRGNPPKFFDGNKKTFTGLYFNLESEEFNFYMPMKMKDDPLWIDVSELMRSGIGPFLEIFSSDSRYSADLTKYVNRLNSIHQISNIELHIDEVTGKDKTIDIVVDIFNRVNSGGTKLSKGDLALAKISAEWPNARDQMKKALNKWKEAGYHFDLDWLLRNVTTVLTDKAKFTYLHDISSSEFQEALSRAEKVNDYLLNLISSRLGLDHDRVFFGRYAMPVMAKYVDNKGGRLNDAGEQDKLLFWYLQSSMWGRFSGSTESIIDKDLEAIRGNGDGLTNLVDQLRLWRGDLLVKPEHFGGWSLGARFYPVLYLLTRIGASQDWGSGIPLKEALLGKTSSLQVHHIFPKALLKKHGYSKAQRNAIANFCFLTQDTNLKISDKSPEQYFVEIEKNFPGALESQWIPMDKELWKVESYPEFLVARQKLLSQAINGFLVDLLHDSKDILHEMPEPEISTGGYEAPISVPGGIESDEEEALIFGIRSWVCDLGLPEGQILYELSDPESGRPIAVLDIAWPRGLQEGFSEPVALLIGEGPETINATNRAGFKYFTEVSEFKKYILKEILAEREV